MDYSRNGVERRFNLLKKWRGLATRYDELATVHGSAVVLNAVITWTKPLSDMPSSPRGGAAITGLQLTAAQGPASEPIVVFAVRGGHLHRIS